MTIPRLDEIVARAATLFDDQGYHQTRMEDIAEAVGLKKSTLYHYIKSKEEILTLIHTEFLDLLLESLDAPDREIMTPEELLRETMRDLIRLMGTHRSHVRVFFEHHRELTGDFRSSIEARRDAYFGRVRDFIVIASAEGTYRVNRVDLATLAVFGMCNWAYQWFDAAGPETADEVAELFFGWIDAGFRSHIDLPEGRKGTVIQLHR